MNEDKKTYYRKNLAQVGAIGGLAAGIMFGVKRKSGFWGTVGWALLFNIAGGIAGYGVGTLLDAKKATAE
jgi:hypothetical protein